MKTNKFFATALAVLALVGLTACEQKNPVETLELTETSITLKVGDTHQLTANVAVESWTSSNPAVAAVSNGLVVAVAEGTAIVSATAAGVTKAANTVYYTVDPNGTNLIDMAQKEGDEYLYSSAVVYGLDKDSTYYLEETKAQEGYNLLDEEKTVNLGSTTSISVVNNAGSVLPSTGGIGTTIFYAIGAVLVIGAGIVLVTRRRMNVQ
jgi:LPXTG-motif cell wall-anchored protein